MSEFTIILTILIFMLLTWGLIRLCQSLLEG